MERGCPAAVGIAVAIFSSFFVIAAVVESATGGDGKTSPGVYAGLIVLFGGTMAGWRLAGVADAFEGGRGRPAARDRAPLAARAPTDADRERQVLRFAEAEHGRVTIPEVATRCNMTIADSKAALDRLGLVEVAEDPGDQSGVLVYVFPRSARTTTRPTRPISDHVLITCARHRTGRTPMERGLLGAVGVGMALFGGLFFAYFIGELRSGTSKTQPGINVGLIIFFGGMLRGRPVSGLEDVLRPASSLGRGPPGRLEAKAAGAAHAGQPRIRPARWAEARGRRSQARCRQPARPSASAG